MPSPMHILPCPSLLVLFEKSVQTSIRSTIEWLREGSRHQHINQLKKDKKGSARMKGTKKGAPQESSVLVTLLVSVLEVIGGLGNLEIHPLKKSASRSSAQSPNVAADCSSASTPSGVLLPRPALL